MRKLLITGIMSKLQLTKKALGALALTVLMLLLNINNVKAQNVCEINGTPYASLEAAFNYACDQYTNPTITLIDHATIDNTISLSNHKNVTLDMAGYDITVNASGYAFSTAAGRGGDFTLTSTLEGSEIISATPETVTGFLSVDAADAAKIIAVENISFHGASGADAAYSTSTTSSMFYDNNSTKPTSATSINEISLTSVNITTDGDIVKGAGDGGKAYFKVYVKKGSYTANHGFNYDAYSYSYSNASSFFATTITTNGYAVKTDSETKISYPTVSEPGTTITVNGSDAAVIVSRSNYQYAAGEYDNGILINSSTITANGTGSAVQVIDGGKVTLQSSTVTSTNSAGHVLEIGESGGTIAFATLSGRVTLDGSKADATIVDKASSGNGKIVMRYVDAKAGTNGLVNLTEMGDNAQVELYYGSSTYQGKINVFENGNQHVRLTSAITLVNGGQVVYSTDDLFNYGGSIKVNTAGLAAGTYKVIDYTGAAGGAATYTGKVSIVSGCTGELSYGTEAGGDYGDVYVTIESLERFKISDGTTTTIYATLAEAVEAVQNGQTIQLLQDVNELENVTVNSGKSFTIDLAGFTYSNTQTLTNNGTITLTCTEAKNISFANIVNGTSSIINVGGNITLNTDMLTNNGHVNVADGGEFAIAAKLDVYADITGAAVINVTGGSQVTVGVDNNNSQTYIGKYNGSGSGKLIVSGEGSSFESESSSLNTEANGTLDVLNKATVTAKGINNRGTINMDLSGAQIVNTGDSWGGYSDQGPRSITVDLTGGTSGTKYKLVDCHGTLNISLDRYGNLSATNAPEGKGAKFSIGTGADAGDLFVSIVSPVCQIGDKKYGSLEEAFGAAEDGQTITLIDNATLDYTIAVEKSITINMNGFDITVSAIGYAFDVNMPDENMSFTVNGAEGSEIISSDASKATGIISINQSSKTANITLNTLSIYGNGVDGKYSTATGNGIIYDNNSGTVYDNITLTNVNVTTGGDLISGEKTSGNARAHANLFVEGGIYVANRGFRVEGDNINKSIINNVNITSKNGIAVYTHSKADLTNSTIDMTATSNNDAVSGSGVTFGTSATLTIINTTINAHGTASSAVAAEDKGNVVVTSGTFTNDSHDKNDMSKLTNIIKTSTSGGTITVNGGNVLGLDGQVVLFTNTYAQSSPDYPSVIEVTGGMIKGGANVSSDNALVKLAGGKYQGTVNVREKGYQWVRIIDDVTLDVATGGQFQYGATYDNTSDVLLVDGYTDKIITADMTGATAASYKIIDYLGNNKKTTTDYNMVQLTNPGDYVLSVIDNDLYAAKPPLYLVCKESERTKDGNTYTYTDTDGNTVTTSHWYSSVSEAISKAVTENDYELYIGGEGVASGDLKNPSQNLVVNNETNNNLKKITVDKNAIIFVGSSSATNIVDISRFHGKGMIAPYGMVEINKEAIAADFTGTIGTISTVTSASSFVSSIEGASAGSLNNNGATVYSFGKNLTIGNGKTLASGEVLNVNIDGTGFTQTGENQDAGTLYIENGSVIGTQGSTAMIVNFTDIAGTNSSPSIGMVRDGDMTGDLTINLKDTRLVRVASFVGNDNTDHTYNTNVTAVVDGSEFYQTNNGTLSKSGYFTASMWNGTSGTLTQTGNVDCTVKNMKYNDGFYSGIHGLYTAGTGKAEVIGNIGMKFLNNTMSETWFYGVNDAKGESVGDKAVLTGNLSVEVTNSTMESFYGANRGKIDGNFTVIATNSTANTYSVLKGNVASITGTSSITFNGTNYVNSSVNGFNNVTISADATLNAKYDLAANFSTSWTNNGNLNIDMTGATAMQYKIVDNLGTTEMTLASYGTVTLSDDAYSLQVIDNDLYAVNNSAVASITAGGNTVFYATLADAIDKSADNGVITMLASTSENVTIPAMKTVTIDLNGKVISALDETKTVITNEGVLTLTDGVGGGNITGGKVGVEQNGTLTLKGKVNITGNTKNLYLPNSETFSINEPDNGMYVGISTENDPKNVGNITLTGTYNSDYSGYFFSDVPQYSVLYMNKVLVLTSDVKITISAEEGVETLELYVDGTPVQGTSAYVPLGKNVTIKTTPVDGYAFKGWYKKDGTMFNGKFSHTFNATESLDLEAKFTDQVIWVRVKKGN